MIKLKKKWAASMAAVSMSVLMACGSATPVLAQSNENADKNKDQVVVVEETITDGTKEEEKDKNNTTDRDVSGALTPNGNLTLVDDLDKEASKEMQFMTVTTRDGSYYYIVIDRSGSNENVYFLNAVDTVDLMNLMSDEEKAEFEETEKPETENIITPEVNLEGEEEAPAEKEEEAQAKESTANTAAVTLGVFGALAALIAGAYYMLKIKPKKKQADYDEDREFYDDDEYENEDEAEETESEEETEDEK